MRREWPHRLGLIVIFGALALGPASARAQDQGAEKPADLQTHAADRKKSGDQAMESLRYADALAAYGEAHAITRDPALLYNMGRALQALNRFPEALDKLRAFDAAAPAELKARVPRLAKLIEELALRVSALTVKTNVAGARVLVRNTVIGKAPLAGPVKLDAGPAEVEIEAEGYFPGKKAVELPGGSELTVELDLFSRSTTGLLSVTASAPGAVVLVDGKRLGIAPVEINVAEGTHKVTVRHPDFRTYETSVVVPLGGGKTVAAALQPPPVVTRPWFLGTVGAVLLTGAAIGVTVAALRERAPDTGTIAPGRLQTRSVHGSALFRF